MQITAIVDRKKQLLDEGTTGLDWYKGNRKVVAMKKNQKITDLRAPINSGDVIEQVLINTTEGLEVIRHSLAHVLAQAVQELDPKACLGIGPAITDGLYYDFKTKLNFTPEVLDDISKRMKRIVKEAQQFRRRAITYDEAVDLFENQPFKLELIEEMGQNAQPQADLYSPDQITIYENLNRRKVDKTPAESTEKTTEASPVAKAITEIYQATFHQTESNQSLKLIEEPQQETGLQTESALPLGETYAGEAKVTAYNSNALSDSKPQTGQTVSQEVGNGETADMEADAQVDANSRDASSEPTAPSVSETVTWFDLCRGPHVPDTSYIGQAFSITQVAGAYWRGSEKNPQLQRIYATCWSSKEELKKYQQQIEEAKKRDHRKLGKDLDLFSFSEEIGPGLALFHPKGATVRRIMEQYSVERHLEAGYEFVTTPHITKGHLFELSGHLSWYKEGMYPAIHLDEEVDEETGNITKQGFDYYLKPMNCPMHSLIFKSKSRSYRELPLRLFELGTVYRYEKSGVVHGLARGRGFTQDDAHIYTTKEQMEEEISKLLTFVIDLLRDFGLNDFYLELSTKNEEKYFGSDEIWDFATATLANVAKASGLELVDDPGGAAFYGPKISVQAKDAIGRTWQISTIQLDFNTPVRLDLHYVNQQGEKKHPVMIHRALFGSIERFFAILLEHYAGAFPAWLAPLQVRALPVINTCIPYLKLFCSTLTTQGIRAKIDASGDHFSKKIRNATREKVPFILIAGENDINSNSVSFRFPDGSQRNTVAVEEAIRLILNECKPPR